jgi:hypothetical protein
MTTNITQTPEESFNEDLWYVLQKLKKQILYNGHKPPITYSITQGFFGKPYNDEEEALVEKLHAWGIIIIEEQNDGTLSSDYDGSVFFRIEKISQKFHQLYRLFEKAVEKGMDGGHLFQLTQELVNPTGKNHDLSFELWQLTKVNEDKNKERSLKSLVARTLTNIQTVYELSAENRAKMKRLIEVIQNQAELTGFKFSILGKDPLEIPIEILEREGFSIAEAELLIDKMDKTADHHFIKVNDTHNNKLIASGISMPHSTDKVTRLIIDIESVGTLEDIKSHLESFERNLEEVRKIQPVHAVKEIVSTSANEKLPAIEYNTQTGMGRVNNKKFKFKDGTSEYRLFSLLYENIGKKVGRYEVLLATQFYEDGENQDIARKAAETTNINDVMKTMREKTGLTPDELVNNNGNITLLGTIGENLTN